MFVGISWEMGSFRCMELQASEAFQPQATIRFSLHSPNPGLTCWAVS